MRAAMLIGHFGGATQGSDKLTRKFELSSEKEVRNA
jgi:hypothetical protein